MEARRNFGPDEYFRAQAKPDPSVPRAPTGITAAELDAMNFPPIRYVVDGYLAEGLTILAGRPKLGKSWMCLDIAIAVASGGVAFGAIRCEAGDVLYAALEDNQRRLQRRMRQVVPDRQKPTRLTFWTAMTRLDAGGLDALRAWIESAAAPRLVIIDVFARVRPEKKLNEMQYDADYRAVAGLQTLASQTGVAIVIVAHVRKMEAEDPLDAVSGTLGFTGAADTVLVLNRGGYGVTLYGRGRDIEEIETAVEFEPDLCRWVILGDAAVVRRSDERKAILAALEDSGAPMSAREIADAVDHPYEAVRKTLQRMMRDGQVEKAGRGNYRLGIGTVPPVPSVPIFQTHRRNPRNGGV
jgi:hypothetical protein